MKTPIPSFYSRWIDLRALGGDILGYDLPNEDGAFHCESCFMTKPRGLTRDLGPFREHLKCCTYTPFLPSFSIGSLLLEKPLESRFSLDTLNTFLRASKLTPWGAEPRRREGTSICETGRHDSDACHFLSRGDHVQGGVTHDAVCTIHSHRPAVCASYVCRSNEGLKGLRRWREFETQLATWENTVATLLALELGFTLDDRNFEFKDLEAATEFYRRAYRLVNDIAGVSR